MTTGAMIIKLSVIVEALERASEDCEQYLNLATGDVVMLPDDEGLFGDDEAFEYLRDEIEYGQNHVRLPSLRELNEFRIMADFADASKNTDLILALRRKKPFRNFKDTASRLGMINDYYRFRSGAFAEIARGWCRDYDVPFLDDLAAEGSSDQIRRISHYEDILDRVKAELDLLDAEIEKVRSLLPEAGELAEYYGSDVWKSDFADDEAGKLPESLKRGVLSEDAVYDLLGRIDDFKKLL